MAFSVWEQRCCAGALYGGHHLALVRISVPLVFLGAYVGFRKDKIEFPIPCKVDSVPREIPEQPWYLGTGFTIAIGGILPSVLASLIFLYPEQHVDGPVLLCKLDR